MPCPGVVSYSKRSSGVTRIPRVRPSPLRRNGVARASAFCVSLGRRLDGERAEVDVRDAQIGRDAHGRDGRRAQPWIVRLAQQQRRQLGLDQMGDAIATVLRHRPSASVVQELDPLLAELGELQAVDELDHLAEARVDVRLVRADLAHARGSLRCQ